MGAFLGQGILKPRRDPFGTSSACLPGRRDDEMGATIQSKEFPNNYSLSDKFQSFNSKTSD